MRHSFASFCFGAALAVAPSFAAAQSAVEPSAMSAAVNQPVATTGAATISNGGPSVQSASVALRHRAAPAPAPAPVPRANTANNRALIVVGAAGLLVGAIVGGDAGTIVMLGSAGIGLYGLYRLLT